MILNTFTLVMLVPVIVEIARWSRLVSLTGAVGGCQQIVGWLLVGGTFTSVYFSFGVLTNVLFVTLELQDNPAIQPSCNLCSSL